MSNIETICEAIATRHLLQICYETHYRVVEPNGYGTDADGHPVLLAWQLEGGGGWDNGHGWRLLPVTTMERVNLLDDTFAGPRPRNQAHYELPALYAHA